jgi:DNA-binding NarL/FixJ family response regulator
MTSKSCACGQSRPGDARGDIRVLVVDDHPLVRASLAELLSEEDGLTLVGECADGSQVVEAATRLKPDVVLMDLAMPVMNGMAAAEALRAARLGPRIVMLTGEGADARPKVEATGAHALVPKGTRAKALLDCLRTVVAGCGCCPYCF